MNNSPEKNFYNIIFINESGERINIVVNADTKIGDLIKEYYKRIQKTNLLYKNFENIVFFYNNEKLEKNYEKSVGIYFKWGPPNILVFNGKNNEYKNYKIIEPIRENIYSSVFKAKNKAGLEIAIKKIFKEKIKYQMKFSKMKEITEEDFKPEIDKFNKEIQNMKKCECENSVEIYDYYDTEKEFVIIMELCDETLFDALCRKENGFSSQEIKNILLQLNKVFKKMNTYKILHRDIKLNNILVKYLNKEKTEYKVLLSDYGISNQVYSLTQRFTTHAGTQIIMAPEILNDEKYDDKCDLWSLGIIIYQLKTKSFPYEGTVDKTILKEIEQKGQAVLDIIDDKEVMREVHRMLGERCNEYVPMKSGTLRASMKAYPQSVRWETPYAHYQYEGEVYGPNIPIIQQGIIIGWYSRPGVQKYPTGRELGIPGEWKGWKFGYTTPGTKHHWLDEAMKNGGLRGYSIAVTAMLKRKAKELNK